MDSLGRQHCVVELEVEGLEGHARRDTGTLEPFLERIRFTAGELILDKQLGELEVTEFAFFRLVAARIEIISHGGQPETLQLIREVVFQHERPPKIILRGPQRVPEPIQEPR